RLNLVAAVETGEVEIEADKLFSLVSGNSHGCPQHRLTCEHCLHGHVSGSSKRRGSSSPARVASMMLTARSLQNCARSASNGTRKCSHSQVSAFVTVNSAGLVISRSAWYSDTCARYWGYFFSSPSRSTSRQPLALRHLCSQTAG